MSAAILEQVKINVTNANKTAKRLCAFFNWKVQWSGHDAKHSQTILIGNSTSHLLITSIDTNQNKNNLGVLAQLGIAVDNIKQVEQDVKAAGLRTYGHHQDKVRHEFCFRDQDDIEYLIRGNSINTNDSSRSWIHELAKMSEFGAMMK